MSDKKPCWRCFLKGIDEWSSRDLDKTLSLLGSRRVVIERAFLAYFFCDRCLEVVEAFLYYWRIEDK